MTSLTYSTVTVTGYNSNPPDDDGTQAASNEVEWQKHLDKIGAPLKTAIESTQTNITTLAGGLKGAVKGFLWGLTTSRDGGDVSNDVNVEAGAAVDGTGAVYMNLSSEITKRADASWAVGDDQGGDDGTVANNDWNFVHLIYRSDTGVVDVLLSNSATSPTLPTNYDYSRRIGSFYRDSGVNVEWTQHGDVFMCAASSTDLFLSIVGTASRTLREVPGLPTGLRVRPIINVYSGTDAGDGPRLLFGDPDNTDASTDVIASAGFQGAYSTANVCFVCPFRVNASNQIYYTIQNDTFDDLDAYTVGWRDDRGREY